MADTFDIRSIRNIGIIAHIDAGKTTTTERVLFYTGASHKMGSVDDGTTITDFDPQEQERGITIRAAAISCKWRDVNINLIDTPGHVDFTAEVERSLRVLDGGVVVFSAVEGVEAQSETVWRQADRYHVPRICFINKLDRIGAEFERVYDEITDRLGAQTLPLQLPIGTEKEFRGVVSLVDRDAPAFYFEESTLGKEIVRGEMPAEMKPMWTQWRERLLEALSDVDDSIMETYLAGGIPEEEVLKKAIRKATIHLNMTPVLCGSSLKHIGVQPLLDAVADFLPSPIDIPPVKGMNPIIKKEQERKPDDDEPFCGLLFKIQSDQHDELGFVRIYSGTLKPSTRLLNATRNKKENVTRIWRLFADERTKVDLARAGDIVGLVGLKDSITGDTLCDQKAPIVLEQITFPKSVISMSVEPESSADKQKLLDVLKMLQKEDPTFRANVSEDTGQMLISGMGELHLEVIAERMKRDYKLKVRTGKPRVSYRETLKKRVTTKGECHRQIATGTLFAEVEVNFDPIRQTHDESAGEVRGPSFIFVDQTTNEDFPAEMIAVIQDALANECQGGGLAGYPLADIKATLLKAAYREGESNEQAYRFAIAHAVRKALEEAGVDILEPVMKLEVTTPDDYLGEVTADLAARRAMIQDVQMRGRLRAVIAKVPLREMFGYSTNLRSVSQGRATYSMEPLDYAIAPPEVAKQMM